MTVEDSKASTDKGVVARDLLRDSLLEAQTTVRGYDAKAQIVGVGYIFALGIVSQVEGLLPETDDFDFLGLMVAWGVVIVPILLFGYVLYPTRKSAPRIEATQREGIQHILYIDPAKKTSVSAVREAALNADPLNELSFELLMVSTLREIKRQRFLRGLFASAISFLCLFLAQVHRIF